MASGGSPWNTSAFAWSANTNVLDEQSMPSDRAAAARAKAAEVMAALKKGEPGDADRLMGDQPVRKHQLVPLRAMWSKIGGKEGKKEKLVKGEEVEEAAYEQPPPAYKEKGDAVIR